MKKHLITFFLLLFISFVQAKEVSIQQAKDMAVNYLRQKQSRTFTVKDVRRIGEGKLCYAVNMSSHGWVIVAGDDTAEPIIGYSLTGSLDLNRLPDNMKFMLDCYDSQIKRIASLTQKVHPYWSSHGMIHTRASKDVIAPLIRVNWNQTAPFNRYCPQQGDKHALVGCVAVAMGQAMSVHRHPSRPQGNVSYAVVGYGGLRIDFDAQRAYNWDDILSGNNNSDEVARLLYHAGMSVQMEYGEEGSGIPSNEVNRISNALKNHFRYSDGVQYVWRDYYDGNWEQLLINELAAGRAVIYNAIDTRHHSGHSFNLDGYDGEGHFHVNWGWGGNGNAYFTVNALRDNTMNMDYDADHVVIIGVGTPEQILKSISLNNSRIEEGLPAGAVVGQVLVNNQLAKATYVLTVSGVGGKSVPFMIEDGLLKTTETLQVETCKQWNLEITVDDPVSGASLTQGFSVTVDAWRSLDETTSLSFNRVTRIFTFKTKHNVTYVLTNEQGSVLREGSLKPLPRLEIEGNSLPSGKNVLTFKCVNETKSIQLITK